MPEKRITPRLRSLNFVAVEGLLYRTLDVSAEGLMLEMASPPPLGTKIQLVVAFGEDVVKLACTVMRHEERGKKWVGVGMKFDTLNSKARAALQQHIIAKKIEAAAKT